MKLGSTSWGFPRSTNRRDWCSRNCPSRSRRLSSKNRIRLTPTLFSLQNQGSIRDNSSVRIVLINYSTDLPKTNIGNTFWIFFSMHSCRHKLSCVRRPFRNHTIALRMLINQVINYGRCGSSSKICSPNYFAHWKLWRWARDKHTGANTHTKPGNNPARRSTVPQKAPAVCGRSSLLHTEPAAAVPPIINIK